MTSFKNNVPTTLPADCAALAAQDAVARARAHVPAPARWDEFQKKNVPSTLPADRARFWQFGTPSRACSPHGAETKQADGSGERPSPRTARFRHAAKGGLGPSGTNRKSPWHGGCPSSRTARFRQAAKGGLGLTGTKKAYDMVVAQPLGPQVLAVGQGVARDPLVQTSSLSGRAREVGPSGMWDLYKCSRPSL